MQQCFASTIWIFAIPPVTSQASGMSCFSKDAIAVVLAATTLGLGIPLEDNHRKFYTLCNGGCIFYIEFNDAPMENTDALADLIGYAAQQGVSYLGFNFPLDICLDCGRHGTFDDCPECGSRNIKRIRRVSGYLEDLNYFTRGKVREVSLRQANSWEDAR